MDDVAAHHEAGHAVMARMFGMFGFKIREVTIVPNRKDRGSIYYTTPAIEGNLPVLMGLVMTTFAGIEAGDRAGEQSDSACRQDLEDAGRFLTELFKVTTPETSEEAQRVAQSAMDATRAILDIVWPAVETVANELLKHDTLTGDEIDALLGPAAPIELKAELALATAA